MKRIPFIVAVLVLLASACQPGVHTPTPIPTPTSTPSSAPPAITVTSPRAGDTIHSPVRVTGQATVFEGTVQLRLKDAGGRVIGRGFCQATSGAPERGDYATDLFYAAPPTAQDGVLEVYEESAQDGSELHMIGVKVRLAADDTPSDWQTYENETYGWTVKYPANWYVNQGEFGPPPPATVKFSTYQVVTGTNPALGPNDAEVWIGTSDPATSLGEIKDLESKGYTRRQVIVSGMAGDRLIAPRPTRGLYDTVYLTRNAQSIRIHLSAATHDYDRTFEQVLATLAFGEPAAGGPQPQSITVYQADKGKELLSDDPGFPEINAAFLKLAAGLDDVLRMILNDAQVEESFGQTNRLLVTYSPATTLTTGVGDVPAAQVLVVPKADGNCQVLIKSKTDSRVWGVYVTSQRQLFPDLIRVVKEQTGVDLAPGAETVAAPQRITVYQADKGHDLAPGDTGFDEIAPAFAQLAGGLDTTVRTIYNDEQVEKYFGKTNRVLLAYTPVAWLPFGDTSSLEVYQALVVDGGEEHGGYQVLIKGVGDPVWGIYMTSQARLFVTFADTVRRQTRVDTLSPLPSPQSIVVYGTSGTKTLRDGDAGFAPIATSFGWLARGIDGALRTFWSDEKVAEEFGNVHRVVLSYDSAITVQTAKMGEIQIAQALVVDGGTEGYLILARASPDKPWGLYTTSMTDLFTDLAATVEAETGVVLIRN